MKTLYAPIAGAICTSGERIQNPFAPGDDTCHFFFNKKNIKIKQIGDPFTSDVDTWKFKRIPNPFSYKFQKVDFCIQITV